MIGPATGGRFAAAAPLPVDAGVRSVVVGNGVAAPGPVFPAPATPPTVRSAPKVMSAPAIARRAQFASCRAFVAISRSLVAVFRVIPAIVDARLAERLALSGASERCAPAVYS